MRDLILSNDSYSDEQWREIADYNRDDVLLTIPLLEALAPTIDVPAALFRGRYATAVVDMEARGIPISMRHLAALRNNGRRCGCSTSGATMRSACTTPADPSRKTGSKRWPTARVGPPAGRAPPPASST